MVKTSHECTNCGAALAIPDQHERFFTCNFCGSVLEDTTPIAQRGTGQIHLQIAELTSFDATKLVSYAAPVAKKAGAIVLIVTFFIVAVTGGVIYAAINSISDGSSNGSTKTADATGIFNYAAASVVGSDNSTGRDVVAFSRGPDGDRAVYIDLDADSPFRWRVDLGFDADPSTEFIAEGDLVTVSSSDKLVALNRTTGAEAWRVTLSDEHQPNICTDCFVAFGDALVTLTADGVLSAHELANGDQRWSVTLTETPRQVVALGGNPAVLDSGDDGVVALRAFDLGSGDSKGAAPMSCPDPTFGGRDAIDNFDDLFPVDGGVVQFGDKTFSPCVQRWDGLGAAPAWEVPLVKGEGPEPERDQVLVADGAMIVTTGERVVSIDLATGTLQDLASFDDGAVFPIGADPGVLVVAVESSRGTGSHQLRAIDRATGNVKWTFDLESTERFGPSFGSVAFSDTWAADVTTVGLSVVQYRSETAEVVVQSIPLESGTASAPSTIDLSPFGVANNLSILGWVDDSLYLLVDGTVLEVDGGTGTVIRQVP